LKVIALGFAGAVASIGVVLATIGIKAAAEFEKATIAFGVFVGDMDRGKKIFQDLVAFSAKTPLNLSGLQNSAQILLATGTAADEVVDTLRMLGDVSRGDNALLQRLALNLGQVRAQGKLTGRELRDFAVAGVPLVQELAAQFGKTTAEIQKMVSAGDVGFSDVVLAFQSMTGEGGRFNGLLNKMSETLSGKWTTAVDNIKLALASIVEPILPELKQLLGWVIAFGQEVQKLKGPISAIVEQLRKMKTVLLAIAVIKSKPGSILFVASKGFQFGKFLGGKIADFFDSGEARIMSVAVTKTQKAALKAASDAERMKKSFDSIKDSATAFANQMDRISRGVPGPDFAKMNADRDKFFKSFQQQNLDDLFANPAKSSAAILTEQLVRQQMLNSGMERQVFINDKIAQAAKRAAKAGKDFTEGTANEIANLSGRLFDLRQEGRKRIDTEPDRNAEALRAGSREAFKLLTSRETGKEAQRDKARKQNKDANMRTATAVERLAKKQRNVRVIQSIVPQ
jgi:tape measure domain-containing protein